MFIRKLSSYSGWHELSEEDQLSPKSGSNELEEVGVTYLGCHVNFTDEQKPIVVGSYLSIEAFCCHTGFTKSCNSDNSPASSPQLFICDVDLIPLYYP